MAGKPKQFTKPPKKQKAKGKAAEPQTAEDFQEAADLEEETGGKWRAGDAAKSGRAFVRALEVYDKGLAKHPSSFDLAYNRARLMLEIAQQPVLVDRIGLPLIELLQKTLDAHRTAQKLNSDNPDILFNTAQVLTLLAEELLSSGDEADAVPSLHEALELLSTCLSKQELLLDQLEQQRREFEAAQEEDGGVPVEPQPPADDASSEHSSEPGEYAVVETPITASDLLDTIQASLSALTTLVSIGDGEHQSLLGSMAQQLCDEKAPAYINLLDESERESSRFDIGLARANFVAANADAQFNAYELELQKYIERVDDSFDLPSKDPVFDALISESRARVELVLSALDHPAISNPESLEICWKQSAQSQNILSAANKLSTDSAKDGAATLFERKGSIELLRYRLATWPMASQAWQRSAPTLLQNSQTFFVGAYKHAQALGEPDVAEAARLRWFVATMMQKRLHGGEPRASPPFALDVDRNQILQAVETCVEEGYLDQATAERVFA